ncbi:Gfo/Idh/MocA family protein [Streptomyces sp. NPDC017405]|uniref:Gfo/Idh/MocA family protein n=1 Tax=unclassified Streptomyces TaxID=2593676 RepID=UPI0037B8163C
MGFIWRGDPALIHLRDLLRAGEIGEVREIRSASLLAVPVLPMNWMYEAGTGGGTLAQHGSHVFDWARWLIGADIAEVHGTLAHDVRSAPDAGHVHDLGEALGGVLPAQERGRFRPVLTDSGYDVRARFADGVRGTFWEAWHQAGPHDDHVLVHGEKGALEWRGSGGLTLHRVGAEPLALPLPGTAASGRAAGMERWSDLTHRFIGGIRKGTSRPEHATFDDGWQAAAVVGAVRRSDASGQWEKVA